MTLSFLDCGKGSQRMTKGLAMGFAEVLIHTVLVRV
jgi:hypothetical protein